MQVSDYKQGFTLIELVTVIIILGIVSVGVSGFIRNGAQIFVDSTERDQLLSDSRFVIERLNRELRNAVPNSVRLQGDSARHCLEFVPIAWSSFYIDIPVSPETAGDATIIQLYDIDDIPYSFIGNEQAIVYPTTNAHVYDASENRRKTVTGCSDSGTDSSCASQPPDDPNNTAVLAINDIFAADSPASRLFIANEAVSYCVDSTGDIFRRSDGFNTNQVLYATSDVLMGENVVNTLSSSAGNGSDDPFQVTQATLTRNASVTVKLRFARNDEIIEFSNEVHIANVP